MAEESYEDEYITNEENFNNNDNAAVMKNFFDVQKYILKKIYYWQGYTLINNKKIETHEPIAPDSFIYGIIGLIDSVVSQHNSVSYTRKENADKILYESITAVNETILEEPLFNPKKYKMFIEEIDHMLELFMGLVINGHGKLVATALQAGVVHEGVPITKDKSIFDKVRGSLN